MRRTDSLPIALLGFVAFVVVAPIWLHYLGGLNAAKPEDAFLAALILPAAASLFVASWISPEFAGLVLGGILVAGLMVLAPWWWKLMGLLSGLLVDDPFAQLVLQLAVPVLILTFLYQMGKRRVPE